MSVETIKGDLLDFPAGINVIGHCCNDAGVMGSGIALSIRKRYPPAYEAYIKAHKDGARVGSISYADVGEGRKCVNLVAQRGYRQDPADKTRFLDYEGFYSSLSMVRDLLENAHSEGRQYVLGLPFLIGCDRAGGDFLVVYAMICSIFNKSPVRCVIVQYAQAALPAPAADPQPPSP